MANSLVGMAHDSINIVWFKRDLRLTDHQPLKQAIEHAEKHDLNTLLIYIFEPMLIADPHYSDRHWRFVTESINDMNSALRHVGASINALQQNAKAAFEEIAQRYDIKAVFSHEEIGLDNTYTRDKELANWFASRNIAWHESQTGAVIRGAKSRKDWDKRWQHVMRAPVEQPALNKLNGLTLESIDTNTPKAWRTPQRLFQPGGAKAAHRYLDNFFQERGKDYHWQISKPGASRTSCSRLSPYLAWGNISLREFYQRLLNHWNQKGWRRALVALSSRLHWHCHFMQKFESECSMQFSAVNKGYAALPYRDHQACESDLEAWKSGHTGYPLVDANMRALHHTGYTNFRMRAMLVSFLCHHLNIDWRLGVEHLASLFLDFEPGIHYPQFQMQASVTGINTVRIYNPSKQAQEHDVKAAFIHRWCPELAPVPLPQIFEPWTLTPMEQMMFDVHIGSTYPAPIVDIKQSYKSAQQRLWSFRKRPDVKQESKRILARHVRES